MSKENIYLEHGYADREEYLQCMADEYNVPLEVVYTLADLLGESEEFDGLISSLKDAEGMFEE